MNEKLAILIPTHNREDKLESTLIKLDKVINGYKNIMVVVILDGCNYKSYEVIENYKNKDSLKIIDGDGSLYWGGAIAKGMKFAFENEKNDFVLWLNDDVDFFGEDIINSFKAIVKIGNEYVMSPMLSANNLTNFKIYKKGKLIDEEYQIYEADTVNGNFTFIPRLIYEVVGNIDPKKFPHFADSPYITKIKNEGFKIVITDASNVKITYDILRHLPLYYQYLFSEKGMYKFCLDQLTNIKSKWLYYYRYNLYKNRYNNSIQAIGIYIGKIIYDFGPIFFVWPVKFLKNKNEVIINHLISKNKLTNEMIQELKSEIDI